MVYVYAKTSYPTPAFTPEDSTCTRSSMNPPEQTPGRVQFDPSSRSRRPRNLPQHLPRWSIRCRGGRCSSTSKPFKIPPFLCCHRSQTAVGRPVLPSIAWMLLSSNYMGLPSNPKRKQQRGRHDLGTWLVMSSSDNWQLCALRCSSAVGSLPWQLVQISIWTLGIAFAFQTHFHWSLESAGAHPRARAQSVLLAKLCKSNFKHSF